jgi:hypothetical protein
MKKFSITLLLSFCLVTPASRAEDQAGTDDQVQRCVLHQHHQWQTPLIEPEFTEEKICASNYIYIELLRTTASDESWEQMCDIVDQVIPESHARQAGAESNMLTCTIKRGELSNYDWDLRLASVVTQVKNVITALQEARCSGATLKVSVDRLTQ